MGRWGTIFLSEEIAHKEAFKKTLTDPVEIAKVEKEIEELRKQEQEQNKAKK